MKIDKDPIKEGIKSWKNFKSSYSVIQEYCMPKWKFNRILNEMKKTINEDVHAVVPSFEKIMKLLERGDKKRNIDMIHNAIAGLYWADDLLKELMQTPKGISKAFLTQWNTATKILEKWKNKVDPQFKELYEQILENNGGSLDDIFITKERELREYLNNRVIDISKKIGKSLDPSSTQYLSKVVLADPELLPVFLKGMSRPIDVSHDPDVEEIRNGKTVSLHDIKQRANEENIVDSRGMLYIMGSSIGDSIEIDEANFLRKALIKDSNLTKTVLDNIINTSINY